MNYVENVDLWIAARKREEFTDSILSNHRVCSKILYQEMEEIIPTVNVRQLISAYERGIPNDYKRPRAASLGNVLGKNVVVRSHNYQTLSDIEDALEIIEEDLNRYQIYNKRKHVEFQETLFTLLTSVINIEPDINEEPVRKKNLITKTKKLVSVLNQKLPSSGTSVSTPISKEPDVQLLSGDKKTVTSTIASRPSEVQKQILENEYRAPVSVQNLKQTYQSKTAVSVATTLKTPKKQESTSTQTSTTNNEVVQEISEPENRQTGDIDSSSVERTVQKEDRKEQKPEEPISVTKLRNMFEEKEKENKTGLELIIKPKTFQYQVFIPYTAETLGTYRFFRANSGNYINEVGGVLNRINISRAKSTIELNSDSYKTFEEKQKEDREEDQSEEDKKSDEATYGNSEAGSQISNCDSIESVKENTTYDFEIEEGEGRITLLSSSVSVKQAISAFEHSTTEEEVHVNTAEMSDVLKEYFIKDDPADSLVETQETLTLANVQDENTLDEDVFIFENGLMNGNPEKFGISEEEPPMEITSVNEITIDSEALSEAEEQFESLLLTNESAA